MIGWIKIHRDLLESDIWKCEEFSRGQAWVDLILLANHKDSFFYKRGNKVDVKRGQVGRSEVELSDRWKWSRSKVRKFLKDLEKEQQISIVKSAVTQVVTIINYDEYQSKEQQKDNRRTTERQQKDIYKNDKNDNNEKNSVFPFDDFWDTYDLKKSKEKCLDVYIKISEEDRLIIKDTLPLYVESTAKTKTENNGKIFRKNPLTYLNQKCWNDEIIGVATKEIPFTFDKNKL